MFSWVTLTAGRKGLGLWQSATATALMTSHDFGTAQVRSVQGVRRVYANVLLCLNLGAGRQTTAAS